MYDSESESYSSHEDSPLRPWRRAGTSQNLPDDDLSFFADPGFPDQETKPCSLNDDRGSPEIGFGGKDFLDGRQGSSSVDMPTPITWDPTAISTPQHYVTPPNQRGQRRTSDILMRDADSSPLANQMSPQLDLKVPGGHEYHSIRKYGPLTRPPLSSSKRLYSNLCDVLESTTVPPPQFYKPNNPLHPNVVSTAGIVGEPHVLSGMKSLTAAIVKVPVDQQIRYLVSAPELLKFLLVEARNKAMVRVLWDDPDHIIAISGVHPYYTGAELPEIAHCERDMEVWIRKLLLQSSLRAWSIIDYGITNPLIFSRKPTGPFWTAGVQAKSPTLADSVLVHEHQSLSLRSVPVILEAKCDNVLRAQSNRSTEPSDMDIEPSPDAEVWKTVFEPITCEGSANSGKAMFFRWPVSPASASNSTLTRIIVQLVMEMNGNIVKAGKKLGPNEEQLGILTSYHSTVFFVRKGDTMWFSRVYDVTSADSQTLMAMFTFVGKALGKLKSNFVLPTPDTRWWDPAWEAQDPHVGGIPSWVYQEILGQ